MKLLKTKMFHVIVLILASSIGVISMSLASAADLSSKDAACQTLSSVSDTGCGTESNTDISGAIQKGIQILVAIAGIIAVIMLIVGGLKYITSSGDAQAIASAKRTIIYAIVGLVIVAFAQIIVQFTLSRTNKSVGNLASTAEAKELSRRERILDSALDSGDQQRIDSAQKDYINALDKYEKVKAKQNNTSKSSGSSSGSKGSSEQRFNAFRVGTLNILGSKHTTSSAKYDSGTDRLPDAIRALENKGISVAALQEVYPDQLKALENKFSNKWGIAAGDNNGAIRVAIWDKSQWTKIKVKNITVPAAGKRNHPFVLLEQKSTKKRIWFMAIHNVNGDDMRERRRQALEIERKAVNEAKGDGHPIFVAGDFNDGPDRDTNSSPHCMLTPLMKNAFGQGSGRCGMPSSGVDQIYYIDAAAIRVRGATADRSVINQRITDHPLVTAVITGK